MIRKLLLATFLALGLNAAPLALDSVVENIKYDSKNNIISGRHDFSEIKSLEEKKIISILESLNSTVV